MKQKAFTPLQKCFPPESRDWALECHNALSAIIPPRVIKGVNNKDPNVSFEFQGGTPASRTVVWQAIHVFCQHTTATPMPAGIAYPGVVDPGVGVALPLTYTSYQGIVHLIASLTHHPSGAHARGALTELQITITGQPLFSISI